jgi:hypothetical protein
MTDRSSFMSAVFDYRLPKGRPPVKKGLIGGFRARLPSAPPCLPSRTRPSALIYSLPPRCRAPLRAAWPSSFSVGLLPPLLGCQAARRSLQALLLLPPLLLAWAVRLFATSRAQGERAWCLTMRRREGDVLDPSATVCEAAAAAGGSVSDSDDWALSDSIVRREGPAPLPLPLFAVTNPEHVVSAGRPKTRRLRSYLEGKSKGL